MRSIHIGLTANNLTLLLHNQVSIKSTDKLSVTGFQFDNKQPGLSEPNNPIFSFLSNGPISVKASSNFLLINEHTSPIHNQQDDHKKKTGLLIIKPLSPTSKIIVNSHNSSNKERSYSGELLVIAQDNQIRLILRYSLEEYVRCVLQAEVPSSFHLEAIKAQAVCARTYALHPRVDHKKDYCDVCDSYLCCQAFSGLQTDEHSAYAQACKATEGQIITYKDAPILALFSSCAGGHTENYQDCFSDWATDKFPGTTLPYLRGISENIETQNSDQIIDEPALKKMWNINIPHTVDAWSKKFRWSIKLSAQDLESTMHHSLSELLANNKFAPFIIPPPSGIFGHIQSFSINKRGIGGMAIYLNVATSKGNWQFIKELTIRSLFKNQAINLARLPSAKIFFDRVIDTKQELKLLTIHGLGSGHGVGLQQIGAEGLARLDKTHTEIISHYYTGTQLAIT